MATLTTNYQLLGSAYVGNTGYSNIYLRLYGRYNYYSVETNTTNVTFQLRHYVENGAATITYWSSSQTITGDVTSSSSNATNKTFYGGETVLLTKTTDIANDDDGSKTISVGGTFTNSFFGNTVTIPGVSCILPTIPRVSDILAPASGFSYTIGNTLTVNVDKKSSSFTDTLRVKVNGVTVRTTTGYTSGTITFTSGEISAMYNACPTVNSATMIVEIETFSGSTSIGTTSVSGTAYVTNSNPIFTNYTFADIQTASVTLTGSNQRFIDGYNILRVTITTTNKAVAQNGATMVRYTLVCGSKQISANYSSSATVTLDLSNVTTATFNVYAEDSRGNQTLVTKSGTFIDYNPQAVTSGSALRTNSVEEQTSLVINGTWWSGNFGSSSNIISATYRYKQTSSSTWINGTTTLTLNTTTSDIFYINQTILGDTASGFDITKSFNLEITITDSIGTYTYYLTITKGEFPLSIGTGGIAVNTLYDNTKNDGLQINGKIYLSELNTAPSSTSSTGTTGEIRITSGAIYVCVATNTWKRVILTTW